MAGILRGVDGYLLSRLKSGALAHFAHKFDRAPEQAGATMHYTSIKQYVSSASTLA